MLGYERELSLLMLTMRARQEYMNGVSKNSGLVIVKVSSSLVVTGWAFAAALDNIKHHRKRGLWLVVPAHPPSTSAYPRSSFR